jgi:two-component system, response regulator
LLVEDNADDVELTMRALRLHRIANRTDVVNDGAEALDYVICRGAHAAHDSRELAQIRKEPARGTSRS